MLSQKLTYIWAIRKMISLEEKMVYTLMQCEHFEQILSKGLVVFNKISMKIEARNCVYFRTRPTKLTLVYH